MSAFADSVRHAADLLLSARSAAAFTGAGISTESGLPDFRSPGGLWAGVDPMNVASASALRRDPRGFYDFYRQRLDRLAGVQPNPGHLALARLERAGRIQAVITQNVDGLHQAAGSTRVIELHGNLREAVCTDCRDVTPIAAIRSALARGLLPHCARCGALLKPNVVLFEELLPLDAWEQATAIARDSGVLVVVGSSLQVTPAAHIPREALDAGGQLVIINREPTPYDADAAVVIHDRAGAVLPRIAAAVIAASRNTGAG